MKPIRWSKYIARLLPVTALFSISLHAEFTEEQLKWLESDQEHPNPTAHVNEGKLEFLTERPDKPEHFHDNHVWIDAESLETGWTRLEQCHTDLGVLSSLAIVYKEGRVRDLQVVSLHNIGSAEVIGHKVVVYDMQQGSNICLKTYSKTLETRKNNQYELSNGPFRRQFLDGFYPLTVSLTVHYPSDQLRLAQARPAAQAGWKVEYQPDSVILSGRFQGKLKTHLLFERIHKDGS